MSKTKDTNLNFIRPSAMNEITALNVTNETSDGLVDVGFSDGFKKK